MQRIEVFESVQELSTESEVDTKPQKTGISGDTNRRSRDLNAEAYVKPEREYLVQTLELGNIIENDLLHRLAREIQY